MTTNIDAAWLAARSEPYFLSTQNETYVLQTDVTTNGTAFIVANTGITLDLNGHTVTFCNLAPVTITNGDFENADLSAWDFTNAPSFSRVAASPYAHGSWMMQGTIASPEYFVSPEFTPPIVPYEYCALVMNKASNSGSTVKVDILRASDSTVLRTTTMADSKPYRGIHANCAHKVTVSEPLKLRITATPASGGDTFWFDWIQFLYSRDYGIYASRQNAESSSYGESYFASGVPTQIYNATGFTARTLPSAFHLIDSTHTHIPLVPGSGLITSGAGAPREGYALNLHSETGTNTVDGVQMKATGIDGGTILGYYTTRLEVTNSSLESDIPMITNRMWTGYNILKMEGTILVEDSTILNSPNYGIGMKDIVGAVKSYIQRNHITQRGIVTERYGLVLGQVSNIDIIGNTIDVAAGGSGRGILLDTAASGHNGNMTDIRISDNDITVVEKRDLEYSIDGLEVPGIRIRVFGNKGTVRDWEIDNNTIIVETGQTDESVIGAHGIRVHIQNGSGFCNNSNIRIHDNDITALCSRAPGAHNYNSAAIQIDTVEVNVWPLIYNNTLESNDCAFRMGSSDAYNATIRDFYAMTNTHTKSASYPGVFTFQSIGAGWDDAGTARPTAGVFILDPQFSGGAPTTWTWVDTGWTAGQTGEILGGWVFTIDGNIASGDVSVMDVLPVLRFTGTADAAGDLGYVPAPVTRHVHTKGVAGDVDTTLTPLDVDYEDMSQSVTPIANQTLVFSGVEPVIWGILR